MEAGWLVGAATDAGVIQFHRNHRGPEDHPVPKPIRIWPLATPERLTPEQT